VYLHIFQQLLAPTAVSLNAGARAGHADLRYFFLRHSFLGILINGDKKSSAFGKKIL